MLLIVMTYIISCLGLGSYFVSLCVCLCEHACMWVTLQTTLQSSSLINGHVEDYSFHP